VSTYIQALTALQGVQDRRARAILEGDITTREGPNSTTGVSAQKEFSENPDRTKMVIVNGHASGTVTVWDSSVTTSKGFILKANGGALIVEYPDDSRLVTKEWYTISDTSSNDILAYEEEVRSKE
tara:strand:+ start:1491 stop:1865 length:375 start_codon:yes stop_codon:yes gene_type:complete